MSAITGLVTPTIRLDTFPLRSHNDYTMTYSPRQSPPRVAIKVSTFLALCFFSTVGVIAVLLVIFI